ncbi:MAG: hypothetical protein IM666_00120 [Phenylobacterium sp.]|uniref:hypothetical protein n=1 Tax=Phenylobacterium sp. TaxID=1871053 RepID=UPI0025E8DEE5|nr:hypothetical protein [Phenylobacterium sp.]MCA3724739.1 hypothetical protein [Phenylobacterium sp.]MCA6242163.1 hypothetical protein [Phenylobacterium sp.]
MRIAGLIWMLRRAAPVLVVLALAMRIVVPAGVMFAETPGGGLQMTLCTGQGAMVAPLSDDGTGPDAGKGASDSPCAFAATSAFTPTESVLLPVPAPWPAPTAHPGVRTKHQRPGLGLPAPPPPKTGPPSLV